GWTVGLERRRSPSASRLLRPCDLFRSVGLWLRLRTVVAGRLVHVGEEVRSQPVESPAVVPPDHGRSEREPEDQPESGRDDPARETGVACRAEVKDGANAGEDLTERLDFTEDFEKVRQCLYWDGPPCGCEPDIHEHE